ncbi:MAG: hypothetical protein AB4368_14135 [Xenococcaceae cyanobacterium]
MSLNCPDLCTADKCRELEARIVQLEQAVNILNELIDNHLELDIPFAHDYNPSELDLSNYVTRSEFNNHTATNIPDAHNYIPSINVDIFPQEDGNNILKIQVDGQSDEDSFQVPTYNLDDIEFKVFNEGNGFFRLVLSIDNRDISDVIDIGELYNKEDPLTSAVQIEGFYQNGGIFLSVASTGGVDTAFISLPEQDRGDVFITEEQETNVALSSLYDEESNSISISITVNGKSATTTIQLPSMSLDEITVLLEKITAILGGDTWQYNEQSKTVQYKIQPETLIKTTGQASYSTDTDTGKELTVKNLIELNTAIASVDYFRSGHHRLPATAIQSLLNTSEGNQELKIYDSLSFQEWIVRNLDALMGEFPLKLKYKNDNGEQEVSFTNLSEVLIESIGLLLSLAEDSNNNLALTSKTMIEARAAANAAIVATDYAAANAEYLGYRGKEVKKEVKVSFTPGKATMKEVLKPSIQKIIGWELIGEETLTELVKRVLIGAEIIRAAMYIPWKPGEKITGDNIKEEQERNKQTQDEKWEAFKNKINTPTGIYKTNKPDARIRDIENNR